MITKNTNRMIDGAAANVLDFGAVGDGVADDTTKIQAAFDSGAETILIPDGTYLLTSTLDISSSVAVNASSGAFLDFSGVANAVSFSELSLVDVNGSIDSSVALTADHLTGSSTITVADTSSFAAGDLILLKSNAYYSTGVSTGSNRQGWLTYVESVDSGTLLSVSNSSYADLTTAQSASISKVNPITFNWNGGSILGGGIGSGHDGFTLDYTSNSSVSNVKVDGCEGIGIGCYYSINVLVDHCDVFNCTSSATLGNSGYGFLAGSGSFGVTASNNEFRNCRHSVSGGGVVTVRGVSILNNRSFAGGLSTNDFDCHEPCFDWVFDGNTIAQGNGSLGGMVVRGKNIRVINNTFNGGNGALFQTFIVDTNGQTKLIAGGNSFVNCNYGIKLDTTSSAISQVRITDNYLENSNFGAAILDDATNIVVSNNIINGTSDGTGTSGQGVDSRGGSDIIISGNLIHSIASDGIYIIGSDKITISGNKAYDIQDHGIFIDNGDTMVITGNHITANASENAFNHGMAIDDVNDLTITGNVVKAFANTANSHGIQISQSAGTALDHIISSNVVIDCDKGIRSVSGADYTVITSNNVRSCTNATKIESTGAGSISANNLI